MAKRLTWDEPQKVSVSGIAAPETKRPDAARLHWGEASAEETLKTGPRGATAMRARKPTLWEAVKNWYLGPTPIADRRRRAVANLPV